MGALLENGAGAMLLCFRWQFNLGFQLVESSFADETDAPLGGQPILEGSPVSR